MHSTAFKSCILALVTTTLLTVGAAAQQAPQGSCLLPNGQWCWPLTPVAYGAICACTTAQGPMQGIMQ